jgi:hypothetical protein
MRYPIDKTRYVWYNRYIANVEEIEKEWSEMNTEYRDGSGNNGTGNIVNLRKEITNPRLGTYKLVDENNQEWETYGYYPKKNVAVVYKVRR